MIIVVFSLSGCSGMRSYFSCPLQQCKVLFEKELGSHWQVLQTKRVIKSDIQMEYAKKVIAYHDKCQCSFARDLHARSFFSQVDIDKLKKRKDHYLNVTSSKSCNFKRCKVGIEKELGTTPRQWKDFTSQMNSLTMNNYKDYMKFRSFRHKEAKCGCYFIRNPEMTKALQPIDRERLKKLRKKYAREHPDVIKLFHFRNDPIDLCQRRTCKRLILKTGLDVMRDYRNMEKKTKCLSGATYLQRFKGDNVLIAGCGMNRYKGQKLEKIGFWKPDEIDWHGELKTYERTEIDYRLAHSAEFQNGLRLGKSVDWAYRGTKPYARRTIPYIDNRADGEAEFREEASTSEPTKYYVHYNKPYTRMTHEQYEKYKSIEGQQAADSICFHSSPKRCLQEGIRAYKRRAWYSSWLYFHLACIDGNENGCKNTIKANDKQKKNLFEMRFNNALLATKLMRRQVTKACFEAHFSLLSCKLIEKKDHYQRKKNDRKQNSSFYGEILNDPSFDFESLIQEVDEKLNIIAEKAFKPNQCQEGYRLLQIARDSCRKIINPEQDRQNVEALLELIRETKESHSPPNLELHKNTEDKLPLDSKNDTE